MHLSRRKVIARRGEGFMTLLKYEIKKIINRPINWITLVVMSILIIIVVSFHAVDSPPNRNLKEQRGFITANKIDMVIDEYSKIMLNPQNFEHGNIKEDVYQKQWKKFSKFERYINQTYTFEQNKDSDFGKESIDYLKIGDGDKFYTERILRVSDEISNAESAAYSEENRNSILEMQRNLKTPFLFDYHDGWQVAIGLMRIVSLIIAAAVAVCIAPILSYDYQYGIDQIIYTAKYGRKKLFLAKYFAGITIVTLIYCIVMVLYSGIIFGIYGIEGYDVPFQLMSWLSPYDINAFEGYLFCLLLAYLSCIVFVSIIYIISVTLKKMEVTLILSWLILVLPLFINYQNGENGKILAYILDILPTNMMDAYKTLGINRIYEILGANILQIYMQIINAFISVIFMGKLTLAIYKRHGVKGFVEVRT